MNYNLTMNNETLKNYQKKLVEEICKHIGIEKQADVIAQIIGSSISSAYKKINLDTAFSFDEIVLLANYFNLSLDQLYAKNASKCSIQMDALRKMPEHPKDYLLNIIQHLNSLTKLSKPSYINLAGEVPIFHFMTFPRLFAFKLYSWNYASWSIPAFKSRFDIDAYLRDKELVQLMEKCAHIYYHFSGIEIWNIRLLDITLDQIKFFIQMNMFKDRNSVHLIVNDLEKFIEHLLSMCESATKRFETQTNYNKSAIKIYINEFIHSNEVISVQSDEANFVFASIDAPNFIISSDPKFTQHLKKWLENTVKHSTQISGEGEKERKKLFNNLFKKLERSTMEINSLLDINY